MLSLYWKIFLLVAFSQIVLNVAFDAARSVNQSSSIHESIVN